MPLFRVAIFNITASVSSCRRRFWQGCFCRFSLSDVYQLQIMSPFLRNYSQYLMAVRKPARFSDFGGSLINTMKP